MRTTDPSLVATTWYGRLAWRKVKPESTYLSPTIATRSDPALRFLPPAPMASPKPLPVAGLPSRTMIPLCISVRGVTHASSVHLGELPPLGAVRACSPFRLHPSKFAEHPPTGVSWEPPLTRL